MTTGPAATYKEKASIAEGAQIGQQERAGTILQNAARAMESGDQAAAEAWIQQVQVYNQDHPSQPLNLARYLRRRQQAQALAAATGAPLGVTMKNLPVLDLTGGL
jgi:hypothetical protein